MPTSHTITALLQNAADGDDAAMDAVYERVYETLRVIARQRLNRHRPGDTLSTTALVHEAYLKLFDGASVAWNDRSHFFAVASKAMRFILVDYARRNLAAKRGGDASVVRLEAVQVAARERAHDVLALDDALERLARHDDRLASLVEYRFFAGLTYEEIADVTGLSVSTLKRDWARARTYLYRLMKDNETNA